MNQKDSVAVICEYNPFHFGHKHQIDILKNEFDTVVCILSGNIVQRGSVAIADKYLRAEAALKSGANLVAELPVPWCCSSARDFAAAGVHIAKALGVKYLAFGAEDGMDVLEKISLFAEGDEFEGIFKSISEQSKSLSYPQIFTQAVNRHLGGIYAEAVKKPNNILALEYIKALKGSGILPFAVKRSPNFESSSQIRTKASSGAMLAMLPEESKKVFGREEKILFPRDEKRLDSFFVGRLRQLTQSDFESNKLYALPADLASKILHAAQKHSRVCDIVSACTDKTYTAARIRRAVNTLVFGITAKSVNAPPPYTLILAADEKGRKILKNARKNEIAEIINKPARALDASEKTKRAYSFAKRIEDILCLAEPVPTPADTPKNPIIIGEN
ncbi:MAG: nucleotidyltransferase family protein [Clostridia bacterium]|nr:nucleotidyltransferase family protein [Clostridia bacterium]